MPEEGSSECSLARAVSNLSMNIPAIAEAAKKLIMSRIFLNLAIVMLELRVQPSKEGKVGC